MRRDDTIVVTVLERRSLPVRPSSVPGLDIVPSHILLSNTDVELTTAKDHREARLKSQLDRVRDSYDYVFVDCPPSLGWLTLNAFTASDKVLIVVSPGYFELDSLAQISKTVNEVKELFQPNLEVMGYLFTMSDPTVNSRTSLQILRQTYTDRVLNTVVPRNTDLRDAHFQQQDVFRYKPDAKAAMAYKKLMKELFVWND